jgi:hypothetical protein
MIERGATHPQHIPGAIRNGEVPEQASPYQPRGNSPVVYLETGVRNQDVLFDLASSNAEAPHFWLDPLVSGKARWRCKWGVLGAAGAPLSISYHPGS